MRTQILFLLIFFITPLAFSQTPQKQVPSQKQNIPQKNEIQSAMNEATDGLRKELADLKKQLKETTDPEEKKSLEEQINMLEKQLAMMGGLNKNLSAMSDKAIQKGLEEEMTSPVAPNKDAARINTIPKKILNDAELLLFIKNVQVEVDKIIPVAEKAEALKMYNETKAEYKSTAIIANAASGCWMMGNWEKALFIMGKVCVDDMSNADNLNNYAAFLVDAGAEQAAIPILEYLNSKYPDNSTLLNNIGQAWFGLGEMDNAKKFLSAAIELYANHSMANLTMSSISLAGPNPDTPRAINFLKASLKESYDPEKEAELEKLGYNITLEDMPELRYPMKSDPVGILEFVESFPEEYPSRIDDDDKVKAINRYVLGVNKLREEYNAEQVVLQKKIGDHEILMAMNSQYRQNYIEPHHNSPAFKVATRSKMLIVQKKIGNVKNTKPVREVWLECQDIWTKNVAEPLARLARAWQASPRGQTCSDIDAATNAYLAEESRIRKKGTELIKATLRQNSASIDEWLKIVLYSGMGSPPKNKNQLAMDLISQLDFTMTRKTYRNAEIYYMIDMAQKFIEKQSWRKSACDKNSTPDPNPDPDLAPLVPVELVKYNLKCEFKKVITTIVVLYTFECNSLSETNTGKATPKKDPVNKGQGHSSKSKTSSKPGPLLGGKGPSLLYNGMFEYADMSMPPLNAEDKDPSQFSIEYDKWGNLSGLNVQLNKDGTALADPDSAESGIDSRWSWNAVASPRKGYLNKLIIK